MALFRRLRLSAWLIVVPCLVAFAAAAPDTLFALDVAPGQVINGRYYEEELFVFYDRKPSSFKE